MNPMKLLDAAKSNRRDVQAKLDQELRTLSDFQDIAREKENAAEVAAMYERSSTISNVLQRTAARRDAQAIAKAAFSAAERVQSTVERITEELAEADRAVMAAADKVIDAEGTQVVKEFRTLMTHMERKCLAVLRYVPDQLHTPIDQLGTTADVGAIAARVLSVVRDDLHIPINQLHRDQPDAFRARRRAELAADDADARVAA